VRQIDPQIGQILSDLFVNLSAGWLGAAFIVPIVSNRRGKIKLFILTANIILGILALIIAYQFKITASL